MVKHNIIYYDCNANKIIDYNILSYKEKFIKELKKKCKTVNEFADRLRREFLWSYWSKCEWELLISIENDSIYLTPWCGCRNPEEVKLDVTDRSDFNWRAFAEYHLNEYSHKDVAKIDVYDQLVFEDTFEKLVYNLWTTRLRYERDNPKFHIPEVVKKDYFNTCTRTKNDPRCWLCTNFKWLEGCLKGNT